MSSSSLSTLFFPFPWIELRIPPTSITIVTAFDLEFTYSLCPYKSFMDKSIMTRSF